MSRVISCWVGGNKHGSHVITSKNLKNRTKVGVRIYKFLCVGNVFITKKKKIKGKKVYIYTKMGIEKTVKAGVCQKFFSNRNFS